ncbi:hypothetical protein ACI2OX_07345 [Bacillus sp. N9]
MKKINFLYLFLSIGICISLGLAALFLSKSLTYNISFHSDEPIPEYHYHFVLIGQEVDNPYFQKIFEGSQAAAIEKIFMLNILVHSKRM